MNKNLAVLYYAPIDKKKPVDLDIRIQTAAQAISEHYPDAELTWALINPGDWPRGIEQPHNVGAIRCETGIVQPGHVLIGTIDQQRR